MTAPAPDDLTPDEQAELDALLKITTPGTALAILALRRGEHPDLWRDGKPEPWPPEPGDAEP